MLPYFSVGYHKYFIMFFCSLLIFCQGCKNWEVWSDQSLSSGADIFHHFCFLCQAPGGDRQAKERCEVSGPSTLPCICSTNHSQSNASRTLWSKELWNAGQLGKVAKRHWSTPHWTDTRTDGGWEPYGTGRLPGERGRLILSLISSLLSHHQACWAPLGITWRLEHQALGSSIRFTDQKSVKIPFK